MSQPLIQRDLFDPLAEERPAKRRRVVHINDVRLRAHDLQIWPDCVAGMTQAERIEHFGDLPPRPKLFVWEVADFFHVGQDTVYRWIYDGTVTAVNVARSTDTRPDYRILRSSVIAHYMRRQEGA